MPTHTPQIIGLDQGMGAVKVFSTGGGVEIPAQVSLNGTSSVAHVRGLKRQRPPLQIKTEAGCFYIGKGAHSWGHPVENLGYDRLTGSAEMAALTYAALTQIAKEQGVFEAPLQMVIGMPQAVLAEENARKRLDEMQNWMVGMHTWQSQADTYQVQISGVGVTSQAVGGLFDACLDTDGQLIQRKSGLFKREVGIVSVGFNTIELLVVRERKADHQRTVGVQAGVRRLMEILDPEGFYTLGELDTLLRDNQLETQQALEIWEREVKGVIDRHWKNAWRRFEAILLVGGGALLLRTQLLSYFEGKASLPDAPVLAIARGLYKLGCMQSQKDA